MYTLLRNFTLRDLLIGEAPGLIAALAIAELFYKFHSFLLETVAFLVTWVVLSFALRLILPARWQPNATRRV